MTEREKIILRHVELAKEYTRLSLSDQSLSEERWKKINQRMSDVQNEIEDLRAIEHTWTDEYDIAEKQKSKLDMFTQEEVARKLHTTRENITMLREVGILKSIKTGKNYMFSQKELERFQCDYAGQDVSNRVKAIEAYKKVTAATVTQD